MALTLLDTMAQRVKAQCDAKLEAAREEAARILSVARQQADEQYAKGLDAVNGELRRLARHELSLAEAEADKLVQSARHDVATGVLDQARERLVQTAQGDAFGELVELLLAEAVKAARGPIQVIAPQAHVERCRAWLSANGHGTTEVIPATGPLDGVQVQDPGRSYRLTNTLMSRYYKLEPVARKLVMARLFQTGDGQ